MLDTRTNDNIPLIADEWKPPFGWREYHQWNPKPREVPPNITKDWLLHLWEDPHDALAFRLSRKVKSTSEHFYRSSHRAIKKLVNDIRMTASRIVETYRTFRECDPDQRLTRENHMGTHALNEIIVASYTPEDDHRKDRGYLVFNICPQKIIEPLSADPDDPPYGWGLYVKEGFAVPELIKTLALFLTFSLVFGVLGYCIKRSATVGFAVFGIWSATIGVCALITTILFKYADAKK